MPAGAGVIVEQAARKMVSAAAAGIGNFMQDLLEGSRQSPRFFRSDVTAA
jgi:hypothetical protein